MPRGGGGRGGGGGGRGGPSFAKPADPSFIRRIKEQMGYKEGPSLEDKMLTAAGVDDDQDVDGEMPTVVVLKDGDLTQEEADKLFKQQKKEEEEAAPADG